MTADRVTVSIITPCYNGGRFIRQTLESALGQSRPPLEVIVIDDGSTDDSASIAEGVGGPVRVIRQANQGESVARNRGLAEAVGTHVLFLDADDLLAPEALAVLAEAAARRPGAVALMGCAWFSSDPEHPDRSEAPTHSGFYPDIIDGNFGPPHCWLSPREVIQAAGGFCEEMRWFEDWDLWWRVGRIPSKGLLESSDLYWEAKTRFGTHGVKLPSVGLDLAQMLRRKDEIVAGLGQGVAGLFKKNKVTRYLGLGRLLPP